MAISGIDMALWAALGRVQGLPACRLLGGEDKSIVAYDSYGIVDPTRDAGDLERSVERGFKAIKIKIGGEDIQQDVDTVQAVREIIGASTRLMVDYNQ